MADELMVYEHGDESILLLELNSGASAWQSGAFEFDEELFYSSFKIYADGVLVDNISIVAQTDDSNDQAAELWPHIRDDDGGTIGNKIEIWIEHDLVDRDAVITWDIDADVLTYSASGNASHDGSSGENLSTYKADFLDHIKSTATGVFLSTAGTLPKLPYLETGLGSPQHTYADLASIPGADIDGSAAVLFAIDVTLTAFSPEGVLFEYGDATNGVSAIFSGGRLYVKAGSSTNALELNRLATNVGYLPIDSEITLGVYADPVGGELRLYLEGIELVDDTGTLDDFTSANAGAVGTVSGDYMQSDTIVSEPARSGFTVESSLRVYEDPTLAIAIDGSNSRDIMPLAYNTTVRDIYEGQAWESEVTKYEYTRSDISDMRDPGDINYLRSIDVARGILSWKTSGSGDPTEKHCFVGIKPGETWGASTANDTSGIIPFNKSYIYDLQVTGTDVDEGVVLFRYGGSGQVTHDYSASSLATLPDLFNLRKVSYMYIEDRLFHVIGDNDKDGCGLEMALNGSSIDMHTWRIGGIYFENVGSNPIGYTGNNLIEASSNIYGHTWGEMCFDEIGANGFRTAAIATGAGNENGYFTRLQIGYSYYENGYSGDGGSGLQAHGVYIKGWVPYLRFKKAWHAGFAPAGPGGMKKMDTHMKMVCDASIGWGHKSGGSGFQNNGAIDGTIWVPTTDRSRNAGRHNAHCCIKDFVWSSCGDYTSSISSSVDCEMRNGILCGPGHNILAFFKDGGESNDGVGQYGGDSYNTGYNRVTMVGYEPVTIRIASLDDREQDNAQAFHEAYMHRCLIMSSSGPAINIESWEDDTQGYTEGALLNRISKFRITESHVEGDIAENETEYANFDAAKADLVDADGAVLASSTASGSVTLAGVSDKSTDVLLAYFTDIGYTYAQVAAAVKSAWADGWDTLPTGLDVDEIVAGVAALVKPTNLSSATYGTVLPGYPQVEDEVVSLRTNVFGTATTAGTLTGATISAEQSISGTFKIVVIKASDGSTVTTDITITIDSARSGSAVSSSPTTVAQGDRIGVETVSASPDINLLVSAELVPSV